MIGSTTTVDAIVRGLLDLEQPTDGYRFNVDAVLLAAFAGRHADSPGLVVDLGAGCGVVGLLLARRFDDCSVLLVEIQPELAALARRNVQRNGLAERVAVRCGDLRQDNIWAAAPAEGGMLVVCNPPFFPLGSGRRSPHRQRARARHEIDCDLPSLLDSVVPRLARGDTLALVYPASRQDELVTELGRRGAPGPLIRPVCALPGRTPGRVLVLAVPGRQMPATLDPLVLQSAPGSYSEEARELLGDRGAWVGRRCCG